MWLLHCPVSGNKGGWNLVNYLSALISFMLILRQHGWNDSMTGPVGKFAVRFLAITWALPCANKFLCSLVLWVVSPRATWLKAGVGGWELKALPKRKKKKFLKKKIFFFFFFFFYYPSFPSSHFPPNKKGINRILSYGHSFVCAIPFYWNWLFFSPTAEKTPTAF